MLTNCLSNQVSSSVTAIRKKINCALLTSIFLLFCSINSNATDYYVAPSGNDANTGLVGSPKLTIQAAIITATNGDIIHVAAGSYAEQVLVNKQLSILGAGSNLTSIGFTGISSGKPVLFDISQPNVSISGFTMNVDVTKLSGAIVANGTNVDNISITSNTINAIGAGTAIGAYGDRNAVSVNYAAYRTATGGVNNISFQNNTITGNSDGNNKYFRAGISTDESGGTFSGNTILSINQDIQVRFSGNGPVNITNNNLNGGGVEVTSPNAGAGSIAITGNNFNGTFSNTYSSLLRLKTNSNSKPTTVSGNTITNAIWAFSLESYNNVTLNNNTFTPTSGNTTYRLITINTKEISSTSGFGTPLLGATLTNNVFNGSGTTGGTALVFYNHDNDNPTYQAFNIGTAGNENTFNAGIANFIKLDNTTGPSATGTSPNLVGVTGFPEYGGNVAVTTMACWTQNIDVVNNKFNVGAGPQLPAAMSITQRDILENYLFHKPDASCTGLLQYYYPVHNITHGGDYSTIQSAIDAASANDSIAVEAGFFREQLSINKNLSFSGAGVGQCGTGTRPANETKLIAPNTGSLINLSGSITVNFDGFEIDSANVGNIVGANQNLGIRNSVFNLNFKPASNNLYFSANTLTLSCNGFKAISGTNDGSSTHLFFAGSAFNVSNNSFTSAAAISSINVNTTSLPVWINLTANANNVTVTNNIFTKVDIGILLASNAGNININNNEFSEAKRASYQYGSGFGAGIAIFDSYTPANPVVIKNNKFYSSETGIRTSGNGTALPDSTKLAIQYNSFENIGVPIFGGAAIFIGPSYMNSANRLYTRCNWFGAVTGPSDGNNAGGSGQLLYDLNSKLSYKNWLMYGNDADAVALGFQLPTNIPVAPGNNTSQAENHYRILSNAIGCVTTGQTITLTGTFNFSNAIAQAEWAKGNNGIAGDGVGSATGAGDDYTITMPDSANNVTITAASLGSATLQGPGDLANVALETPLFFNSRKAYSSYKSNTVSNLIFRDFDLSMMADNNGGPANAMDNFTVSNNEYHIPADLSTAVAPADNFQNIGIHLNFGKNQTITNNTIYIDGSGLSDSATGRYSSTVALQSATSGSDVYDGLKITNNKVHITGIPSANPARIVGFWENSNNQTAAIELSGNTFVNDDAGNQPANNRQLAFRVTSFSGDVTHQVVYKNNEITGFNRGISFIGDPFSQYGPNPYSTGENPVVITNNKIDNYKVAISIIKDVASTNSGSPAIVNNNSFTHVVAGGFAISNESTGTTAATCNWYDTVLVANILNGSITYLPKLSNGIDANVATGFQVDPSNTCVSPVLNVNTGNTYITIQAAVNAATAGDSIFVSEGIYTENVVVNKALKITGKDSALVILDKGNTNYLNDQTNIGFNITASNVYLKKMKVRNYGNGIYSTVAVTNLSIDSMSLIENYNNGFYTNQNLDSLVIKNSILSYNGFKGGVRSAGSSFRRGIFTQSTSADFSRFNIHDNLVEMNGLTGIDINSSHSTSGLTIQNNISRYNFDEQIGVWLGNNNETMGAILVKNNTLTLSDSAHYGMEMRMPHGTTTESGNGSVLIQGNTVSIINPSNSIRDKAAIAVIRRKDGYDATVVANDQPQGVVIKDNIISNFQNAGGSGSAFGIVVGGIGHRITGNTISNTQVPLQLQKGNDNATNNNNSLSPYAAGNEYFDRDNSSDACAEVALNTYTGDAHFVTGPSTVATMLPPTNVTNTDIAVKFCSIQSGIDYSRTTSGNTLQAVAGLYAEDIIVSKPLTILGPNSAVNPCTGTRLPEAIVVPKTKATSTGEIFHVAASNVTISGFLINGDNPALTSGYLGLNNADIDAAEGITIYEPNINNLTVTNNIIKNLSFFGITLNGDDAMPAPTSGHIISNNKIQTMGTYDAASGIARWGGGMLLYNNHYAAVTNNCIDSARLGIQTGNYYAANPGAATYQVFDGNTFTNIRRTGIFHNLAYSTASPFTISNNSITGTTNINENKWDGVLLATLSVPSTTSGNIVTATAVSQVSSGIEVWNVAKSTPASITGGSITNATRGVFVNNYDGYISDASLGANAIIAGVAINNAAADTGILIYDNPLSTHVKVNATIGDGVTITGGTHGLVLLNDSTAIGTMGNTAFTGQSGDYIRLIKTKSNFTATTASFGGVTPATATLAQNFIIEDKITHKIDDGSLGFVTIKANNAFVTTNSFISPATTTASVQRGVDASAANGFTVNVADGIYNGDVNINKSLTLLGQSTAATIRGLYAGSSKSVIVSANNVTVKDVTITRDYGTTQADWNASLKTEGLIAENLTGLTLDHIIVTDNRNGILINSVPGFVVKNSTVRHNRTGFQLFGNLDNGQVINNFIDSNFTHGLLVNFDQLLTTGNNLIINNNFISANWYSQIDFQNSAAQGTNVGSFTNFNANCNWYGSLFPVYNTTNAAAPGYMAQTTSQFGGTDPNVNSDIRGVEAALITYKPYLQDGTDNDAVANGFQPVPGNCSMAPTKLYVNDAHTISDVYTTTSGDDANGLGTSGSPFATISRAIAGADAGDTIYVDGGNYVDTVNVIKKLQLRGANYGINPNTGSRVAESVIFPLTSNPVSNGTYIAGIAQTGASSRIDGFTLDGNNPALTSAVNVNGSNIDAAYGIVGIGVISNDTLSNNIVKNTADIGIVLLGNGTPSTGNIISNNKFDNISAINGVGAYLINNPYANITNNVMTGVKIGAQTTNFGFADPGNTHSISNNTIESSSSGILHNNFYGGASNYVIANNTLNTTTGATNNNGILVLSIQSAVGAIISNNNITGAKYGYNLWNNPTTSTLNISGGTLTNCETGVFANNYDGFNSNATSSSYKVSGVTINGGSNGVYVKDNSLNSNSATVSVTIDTNTVFGNNTTGLLVQGASASASFGVTTPATFTGNTKYIKLTGNGTDAPTTQIDATAVTFDGVTGSSATLDQNYGIEDKIDHKIDSVALGFVLVKASNTFVTTNSFIAPGTTMSNIQRGVDAASNGFTVNVSKGTFTNNVTINKSVTMSGAQVGANANTRFGSFSGLKADPTVETVVTTPTNNPTNGNPSANDLFRVVSNDVIIDGFTFDGNNPLLAASSVLDNTGLSIHARRAITNIDSTDGFNPVNNLVVRNNIMQNVAQRGVSLANNGTVSTGNSVTGNVIRNFGWDPVNGGQGVILFTNAYANITNNTIDVPHDQIGLHLQNFYSDGTMNWSGNTITVGQNSFGIHANNFYAANGVLNVSNNIINAAAGVTGTSDSTWGVNVWSVQSGSTVNINNNTIGGSGGAFARGINLWNMPTSNTVTVNGGSINNSVTGINLDNVDLFYGSGSTTIAKVIGTSITASQNGVRTRAAALATPPAYGPNTVGGSVSLMLNGASVNVNSGNSAAKGVVVNAPAASTPNMATVYLRQGTTVNNTNTSDTAVLINGNQAQLYADTSNIKMGSAGAHDAIQFANITSSNTVSNLVLAGGTTINRNGNLIAKAFTSPQYSIVEMDAPASGWTAPDSTVGGNQSILIDGAMKFTSGNLNSGNSIIEFGTHALDIMNSGIAQQEKSASYILGNARMLARTVGMGALDMLGARLAAQTGASADVGDMTILRTTLATGAINPAFPGNNSIRTTWVVTPTNATSSRSDVQYRYLGTNENLNAQTPSSIYAYRYTGGQWTKVSATLSSTQSGNVYTTASFGVPGFSPWTLSSQSSLSAPDLLPFITLNDPSFTPTTTTQPITISIYNSGPVASTAAPIVLTVLKPSRLYTTLTLTNDATGTDGWTILDRGSFYLITSKTSPVISGNYGFVSITGNLNTSSGIAAGTYNLSVTLSNNTGGETNNTNNTAGAAINVNN